MEPIIFNISDWDCYDKEDQNFVIKINGRMQNGKSVYVEVLHYLPYFYIKVPKQCTQDSSGQIIKGILSKTCKAHKESIVKWKVVRKHRFRGFTNNKKYKYLKIYFSTYKAFKYFRYKLSNPGEGEREYKLYESNIEPLIRLIHARDLKSVGWLKIDKYKELHGNQYTCDLNINTNWRSLNRHDDPSIAPFIIAAFDIECVSSDTGFPNPDRKGDKIIQIGTTFSKYGEGECFHKTIITLGSCDDINNVEVIQCERETDLIIQWQRLIGRMDPDILTGYNIFGFDEKYIEARTKLLGCFADFGYLGRDLTVQCQFIKKELASSALGENIMFYYNIGGRVQIDLLKVIQRDHKLLSYKLDSVASEFIKEKIVDVINEGNTTIIKTSTTYGLDVGRFIRTYYDDGLSKTFHTNSKYKVLNVTNNTITINGIIDKNTLDLNDKKIKVFWCQAKDDVDHNDIIRLQQGSSADRKRIAEYCLQDCMICNRLINKLQIITNNVSMANVCHVPLSYIFFRGQGIKILSLVAKKCRELNYIIPVLNKNDNEDLDKSYEGAIVFEPEKGIHYSPVYVQDYNSLYPNSMRYGNYSHDTCVIKDKYNNLPGYRYHDIVYHRDDGTPVKCRYAIPLDGSRGILPQIITELLDARNFYKNKMENEVDSFKKKIFDSLQLAYKVTANSLYGQTGADTSAISMPDLAGSTCATGREMLNAAKIFNELMFNKIVHWALNESFEYFKDKMMLLFDKNNLIKLITPTEHKELEKEDRLGYLRVFINNPDDTSKRFPNGKDEYCKIIYNKIKDNVSGYTINAKVIYGDTDSVFVKSNVMKDNILLYDQKSLEITIQLGLLSSDIFSKILPWPMNMPYEKTFFPFALISKKRYVANKYEKDPNSFYQCSMGIVTKRRDNADIVKIFVGGIIKCILNDRSSELAIKYTHDTLDNIFKNKYPINKYVITKTKRAHYSEESQNKIAHVVLADRMEKRNGGVVYQSNERVEFVYIVPERDTGLQCDRIEDPEYIIKNKLQIDYVYYIDHQIMNPAMQFLELITKDAENIFIDKMTFETARRKGMESLLKYCNNDISKNNLFDNTDFIKENKEDNGKLLSDKKKKTTKVKEVPSAFICDEEIEPKQNSLNDIFNGNNNITLKKKTLKKSIKRTKKESIKPTGNIEKYCDKNEDFAFNF